MEDTRIIEISEDKQRLIIHSLNDKRNELVEQGCDTDFVDETLLEVMDAPSKREKRKFRERER